ncbi:MAG: hypothetical protein UT90_C0014G0004 [Parcubacteria group bacterium GW2011_GWA1_40_21]|nr:MAG: hypothetical protein UT80_C0013G0002 [Parcubacteria group bacterium GW2011_GWC1_40_13]KKR53119.1 MAG: hypothetical protein UT90_C0014G0004 [Parcubacteria group bacterium GW2011_GWA1_40_21]
MSEKKMVACAFIFLVITSLLNLFGIWDSQRKFYAMHECGHQLVNVGESIQKKTERHFKEIQNIFVNFESLQNMELKKENLELRWQNEKFVRELLNMFNLLRGREMPIYKPLGKVKI